MNTTSITSSEHCVWVSAGVLNNKLCDRNFDCEHCPLDAALRDDASVCSENGASLSVTTMQFPDWEQLSEDVQRVLAPLRSIPLCTDARYSARHAWVRLLPSGLMRIGVDAFAAAMLPDDAQLITVAHNTVLREGEALGWVYAWNKTLPLPAPVSGVVTCRGNDCLRTVKELRHNPYRDGSLLTLTPTVGAIATARVYPSSTHRKRIERHCRKLTGRILRALSPPEVGLCLNDGGAPVASLPEMFGDDRYWGILKHFFGGTEH